MIDAIDRNIMIALSKDGRYSYAQLAKALGVKATTVARRVDLMLKDDVFIISAVPNPLKLGYKVMAVITLDVELCEVDNVCTKLIDISNVSSIITTFGRFDIILFVEYPSLERLYRLVKEEIPKMKGVKSVGTLIISEMKKAFQRSFSIDSLFEKPVPTDEIDEYLIKELRKNGRETFTVLAEQIGVSPAMVSRRVASLIKKHVIQITVVPNPLKLGRSIVAYVGLQVELSKLNEVSSRLSSYPQMPTIMTLMNGYDILAVVALPNLEALHQFIMKELAFIDGVTNVETVIRAEFKKRTYLGFNLEERLLQLH